MRVTYAQDWEHYNLSQTHEQEQFISLLRELCNGIPQPEYQFGRPRLPLSDVVFGIIYRIYTNMSGRRFDSFLRDTQDKGLIDNAGCYNSGFNYLDNPNLTPVLKGLIEQSARSLKSVETQFAVDSSGFSTSVYNRWIDYKYGKERKEAVWIKAHLMCGVKTHIVTSVEISPSGDAPQLPGLVANTAKNFQIKDVSADRAYSSKQNLHAIEAVNAMPYIPFKENAVSQNHAQPYDSLWDKMFHYFNFNRAEFMEHYHKRSNVETVFSMIKGKFGTSVRAKTPNAQVNEVLGKILCHNICCVINSIYELGIEPVFWNN
jgi:transposase